MKFILVLFLLNSFIAFANEDKAIEHSKNLVTAKVDKKTASKEAYKKAKESCLTENHELKGKPLKECIVKKQSEVK